MFLRATLMAYINTPLFNANHEKHIKTDISLVDDAGNDVQGFKNMQPSIGMLGSVFQEGIARQWFDSGEMVQKRRERQKLQMVMDKGKGIGNKQSITSRQGYSCAYLRVQQVHRFSHTLIDSSLVICPLGKTLITIRHRKYP
jgi:hypothetical protein